MSDPQDSRNPFPGPQPYRAADRHRFFGREALVTSLTNQLLAHPATTLFGPSGAGKTSLLQAGVIPSLKEVDDFRVVRVDAWPPGERPLSWLHRALHADLGLGAPPLETPGPGALEDAMSLAERQSDQPILICLDQIEQLLFPDRAESEAESLIEGVGWLARAPIQGLQIVLALREDYLGRFRDRARDRRELLTHGFRVGPLTVGEMVRAVCRAADGGEPPQRWDEAQIRALMLEVRMPGERESEGAEVQAVYAQIVCRALFQERARREAEGFIQAESILHRYLEATLDALGPLGPDARRVLEEHLVAEDGSRTIRTEKELARVLPAARLSPILDALERAAILHAEAHQGSRYFEVGHDWLAKKVRDERLQRERDEASAQARARERRRRWARIADAIGRSGSHLSIVASAASSFGSRPTTDEGTVPTGFDPEAAVLFEAIVESAFLVANANGVFGDAEREAFVGVVEQACGDVAQRWQVDALTADLTEQLAEDGLEKRARMVARTITKPEHQLEVIRVAAQMAHLSGDVTLQGRQALEHLAQGFGLGPEVVQEALIESANRIVEP